MMDFTDTLKRNLELSARCYLAETEVKRMRDDLERAMSDRQSALDYGEDANRVIRSLKAERTARLDQAWEAINHLGAPDTAVGSDPYERGYCQAIKDAMAEIEKLGGQNPAARP